MSTRKSAKKVAEEPVSVDEVVPIAIRLNVVTDLLLALEETLVGSSPDPARIRELYAKLKEANP